MVSDNDHLKYAKVLKYDPEFYVILYALCINVHQLHIHATGTFSARRFKRQKAKVFTISARTHAVVVNNIIRMCVCVSALIGLTADRLLET